MTITDFISSVFSFLAIHFPFKAVADIICEDHVCISVHLLTSVSAETVGCIIKTACGISIFSRFEPQ
jgi:hypothetical protein